MLKKKQEIVGGMPKKKYQKIWYDKYMKPVVYHKELKLEIEASEHKKQIERMKCVFAYDEVSVLL